MRDLLKTLADLAKKGIRFYNEPVNIDTLRDRLLEINETMLNIVNTAEHEERELTDEEIESLEDLKGEFKRVEKRVNSMENVFNTTTKLAQSLGRKTEPEPTADDINNSADVRRPAGSVQVQPWTTRGNWGFRNIGEFAMSVQASRK